MRGILIACCDGLTGLPDAIRSVFTQTLVQTGFMHVIRNSMKFVSYGDLKKLAVGMKAIYGAPTVEAAELAFASFRSTFGDKTQGRCKSGRTRGTTSSRSSISPRN